jgi:hypothetical protein
VLYIGYCVLPFECDVKLTARLWIEPWTERVRRAKLHEHPDLIARLSGTTPP